MSDIEMLELDDEKEIKKEKNTKSKDVFEEVGPNPNPRNKRSVNTESDTDSYFDGSWLELLAFKSLKTGLSILSLGFLSPWGDCYYYRFLYKHTVYNGKRLKFEGNPSELFAENFKWTLFQIITFGIYSFFVPVRKKEWELSNVHFEDEELKENDSYFTGSVLGLIGINIITFLITVCSLGLLAPLADCIKTNWVLSHSIINRKVIEFNGNWLNLFVKRIVWLLLTIITFGIYGWFIEIKTIRWITKNTSIKKKSGTSNNTSSEVKENIVSTNKKKSKLGLFIVGGILLVGVIVLVGFIISFFKPMDTDDQIELMGVLNNAQSDVLSNNVKLDGSLRNAKDKNAKNLNIPSIDKFIEDGGKAIYDDYYLYSYNNLNELYIEITVMKNSTVCSARLSNQYQTLDDVNCKSKKDYYFDKINLFGSKKTENVIY